MKKWRILVAAVLTCLFFSLLTVNAEAASYKKITGQPQKIGSYYMWSDRFGYLKISKTKNGSGKLITSDYPSAISNGTNMYIGNWESDGLAIFKYNIASESWKRIGYVQHGESIAGYYNGKLFIERHATYDRYECDYTWIHTYAYTLKNGKLKRVMKGIGAGASNGKYIVGMPNSGAVMELPLKVYNAKSGKVKTITKKALAYRLYGNHVYYVQANQSVNMGWTARLYRYTLTTGKKKTLSKSFKTTAIHDITKQYVEYADMSSILRKIKY